MYNTTSSLPTRAARIALVQGVLLQRRIAAKEAKAVALRQAAAHAAYLAEVQAVAAKYGVQAPNTLSVRPSNTPQKHAPSTQSGACKQVHALAEQYQYVRSAVLKACEVAGINPATAATQFAIAKRNHIAAQAQVQAE